jgi:UPF0176 protein
MMDENQRPKAMPFAGPTQQRKLAGSDLPGCEVAAFYKFAPVKGLAATQMRLKIMCEANGIRGMILVAPEGLNGTIAGASEAIEITLKGIRAEPGFERMEHKTSFTPTMPFKRLKVRLKKEIVTIGDASVDPGNRVGTYVEPKDWNALILDPDVLVIDTRNTYECGLGTFEGAIDPGTRSFSEFPAFVRQNFDPARQRKVAMFCTGGIRCEKASSFMLGEGYSDVFHLKGGILSYLEQVPAEESLWQGSCFVFDERVAVGHGLQPEPVRLCMGCNTPLGEEAMQQPDYEEGVCCPACSSVLTQTQKSSARERQMQVKLALKRGTQHLGPRDLGPRDLGPRDFGSRDFGSRDFGSRDFGSRQGKSGPGQK